jgi:hypothetical protein
MRVSRPLTPLANELVCVDGRVSQIGKQDYQFISPEPGNRVSGTDCANEQS